MRFGSAAGLAAAQHKGAALSRTLFGHLFFLVMAVLALIFYKERITADSAHYLVHVVDSGNFRIEHQRYILAFSQILPLIGVKMGLSLKMVMILYSLNPVLYFYGLYLYACFYLRDHTAGTAIILVQVLGILNMFFCPMYEIWYGTALVILVYAHARQQRWSNWLSLLLFTFIMYTALFAHPLLFIPVIFVLLFSAAEQWYVRWTHFAVTVIIFASWYFIKKAMLTEYEAGKLSLLDTQQNHSYQDLISAHYLWGLAKYLFTYYTIPMLMYLFTIGFYLLRGARYKALLVSAFFLGHILLINITHVTDPVQSLYFERMYMPLIPICLIPFLYDVFVQFALRNAFGIALAALVIGWRLYCIIGIGKEYIAVRKQLQEVKNIAHANGSGSKFEIQDADYHACFKELDWSSTMQIMLLSGLDGPDKTLSIVYSEDMTESGNREKLGENNYLLRRWEFRNDDQSNKNYFRIRHGKYVLLPRLCK